MTLSAEQTVLFRCVVVKSTESQDVDDHYNWHLATLEGIIYELRGIPLVSNDNTIIHPLASENWNEG